MVCFLLLLGELVSEAAATEAAPNGVKQEVSVPTPSGRVSVTGRAGQVAQPVRPSCLTSFHELLGYTMEEEYDACSVAEADVDAVSPTTALPVLDIDPEHFNMSDLCSLCMMIQSSIFSKAFDAAHMAMYEELKIDILGGSGAAGVIAGKDFPTNTFMCFAGSVSFVRSSSNSYAVCVGTLFSQKAGQIKYHFC